MKDISNTGTARYYNWPDVTNVDAPEHYTDDFSADGGYFNEENGEKNWRIENGTLHTEETENDTLTCIHVYEKNVEFKARVRIDAANPPDAVFGMLLRYNAEFAYCRIGYFTKSQVWVIDSREDKDHPCFRHDQIKKCPLEMGKWHDLCFTVNGTRGIFTVDGETVFDMDELMHNSPGKIGFFTNRTAISVDSVDIALLSGQGVIWKDAMHTKLPVDQYTEGGSVFEMKDGSLKFTHHSGATFNSFDNGTTWEETEKWTNTYGYVNIFRLNNGDFLKIASAEIDGVKYKISQTSSDDGKTWLDGGKICYAMYGNNTKAFAGNMNDKITQSATTGRIFYGQNYEIRGESVNGRYVFCELYYSDDNGATWTKSGTDSWEIPGNENEAYFGECKILECDDGSLRIYNSWNSYPCVVYSESHDNGKTWGPLIPIPELICARSSMQFVRDRYADNDTTYYMVWVNSPAMSPGNGMTRSRLSLAKSTNGKDWVFMGDVWRWETRQLASGTHVAHVVDAFIKTTKDYIICGAGYSEHMGPKASPKPNQLTDNYHHAQRQHIFSVPKASLPEIPLDKIR